MGFPYGIRGLASASCATRNGLGNQGQTLASGVYFARLRVQGPGINEELTRKITLTR